MSERQRLPLLAVIIVAAFSAPDPSAQAGAVMTPAPFATAPYALPQGGVESTCAAKCQQGYDRAINIAADKVARRAYYAAPASANCPAPWQATTATNACVAAYFACDGKCGTYDDRCKAPCVSALQTCCNANDAANIAHERDVCLQTCSAAPSPAAATGKDASVDPKSEWAVLFDTTTTMLKALGQEGGGIDPTRLNEVRRALAFVQVTAAMAMNNGKFSLVSGGQGRLWLIKRDGTQIQVDPAVARDLRGFAPGLSGAEGLARAEKTHLYFQNLGFSYKEAVDLWNGMALASMGRPFAPGEFVVFPADGGWPKELKGHFFTSAEHASIRGTINGGGDFI
jgi:hypothetical protein